MKKTLGLIAYVVLLLPIYVLPWVGGLLGLGTMAMAMEGNDSSDIADAWVGVWAMEALCYILLLAVVLVCAGKARWTGALVALAAAFDLIPLLDFVPLVPTVLLITAFVFIAKEPKPETKQGAWEA